MYLYAATPVEIFLKRLIILLPNSPLGKNIQKVQKDTNKLRAKIYAIQALNASCIVLQVGK